MDIARENNGAELASAAALNAAAASHSGCAIYDGAIPDFVDSELQRLYESVYCTLARFAIYREAEGASTYVARAGNAISCLLLFHVKGSVVQVVNQQVTLSAADLRAFCDTVFARYPRVRRISLYAVETGLGRFPYPYQSLEVLEENVLHLPSSTDEYQTRISENLLKRLQAAERKLQRDHPQFRFEVLAGRAVTEPILREIVALADARMAAKQQASYIREQEIGNILRLVHACGYASVLTIDGKVRGGNVFYGVGKRYFMHIIAHDPGYDKYMLGHMVQYLAACHCIGLGGRECRLMGGGRENKARFGARAIWLSSVDIYRSRLHQALCAGRVAVVAGRRWRRRMREAAAARIAQGGGNRAGFAARVLALARAPGRRGAAR